MNVFGLPNLNPPVVVPQQNLNEVMSVIRNYESRLRGIEKDSCLILFSSKISSAQPLDSVVFGTLFSQYLRKLKDSGCERLWFHLTAFGGDIRVTELVKKLIEDLSFNKVNVIAPLRLGATASLLSFIIYDELYVNSNTIVDPFNITVNMTSQALDLNTFLEVMDFLLKSQKQLSEVEDAIRTQAYSILLSSGALFGYVEASKEMKFIKYIIENYIVPKLKVHESEFEETFLGGDKLVTPVTGSRLKDLLIEVKVMDKEVPEISKASVEVEERLQSFFEQSGSTGVLATSTQITTFNGPPLPG